MTCREISEFLLEYVAGEIEADVRAEFEAHVQDCATCHEFLRQYRAAILAGQRAFADPDADAAAAEVPEDLVRAIMAALQLQP